jgi:arsenate reductase
MANWSIYYNPRCGTCRLTLEIFKFKKVQPKLIEYLKDIPSTEELDELLKKLKMEPAELVRTKEPLYEELKLADAKFTRAQWLKLLHDNPILIQRPVVVKDNRAIIARPPEKVHKLF